MPMPKRPLTDHEKDAYSILAQHMGHSMDERDMGVAEELDKLVSEAHEKNYKKMQAAQTGGASVPMGPSEIEQAQVKQRSAGRHQAVVQGAQQALQAQAAQADPNAPPAPASPVGASQPYPAQSGPQPPPNVQPSTPEGQAGAPQAPGGTPDQDQAPDQEQ